MGRHFMNIIVYFLILIGMFILSSCATIQVGAIPPPPADAKLRVYVEAFTTFHEGKGNWKTPHDEFVEGQVRLIKRYLTDIGIYEIVGGKDVRAVLGEQRPTRAQMERNDWAPARKIGKALHADYVMVLERGTFGFLNEKYFFNMMLNVETGKKFGVRYSFKRTGGPPDDKMKELVRASYRDIFFSAKEDLLATAIRKSEHILLPGATAAAGPVPENVIPPSPPLQELKPAPVPAPIIAEQPAPMKERKTSEQDWVMEADAEKALTREVAVTNGTKLAVYDLEAPEAYKPVALILTEALREELFLLKQFTLVNREDLQQVLRELALQQTGLIDEKQAAKTGKGLAANQVVTGRLGLLGKTYVLQTKRIEVETLATLGLASARFTQGQEDEVLGKMPELAKHLAGR